MKKLKMLALLAGMCVMFSSCKKDDDGSKPDTTPTSKYYFKAKLDGKDILLQDKVEGYVCGAKISNRSSNSGHQEGQSMFLAEGAIYKSTGVSIIKEFPVAPTKCSQIEDMFHKGTYTFGSTVDGSKGAVVDGVVIFQYDDFGTSWATDQGLADQTGSYFEILEHTANNDGYSERITKSRFNCKLYDGNGNAKVLTDGEMNSRSTRCDHL